MAYSKTIEKRKETFIEKANKKFDYKYDYSKVDYKHFQTEVEIICKIHGSFFQTPELHLISKIGCYGCVSNFKKKPAFTSEQFIKKAIDKFEDLFDYSKTIYMGCETKVEILCKKHGSFWQTPIAHLKYKICCPSCEKDSTGKIRNSNTEQFIEKAIEKHGYTYDYSKVEYTKARSKIIIICKTHGEFEQKASGHLTGYGCPKCASLVKGAGFSRSGYVIRADNRTCTFYILRCFSRTEEFYKIGRTMNTTEVRYSGITAMPYGYEVISEVKGSAGFIWDLERDEKIKLKTLKYIPQIEFAGSKTECFTDYKI